MNSMIPIMFWAFTLFVAIWLIINNGALSPSNNDNLQQQNGDDEFKGKWNSGDVGWSCDKVCHFNGRRNCIDDLKTPSTESDNKYWPCVSKQVEFATKVDTLKHGAFCHGQYMDTHPGLYPLWTVPMQVPQFRQCWFHQDFRGVAQVGICAKSETNQVRMCWCVAPKYNSTNPPSTTYSCP